MPKQFKGRGFMQITGRQMGKSYVNDLLKNFYASMQHTPKITWHQLPGYKLKASWEVAPRGFEYGLKESDMDPIHQWSKDAKCGVRVSFDMWKFQTPEEMTMFLLRWS